MRSASALTVSSPWATDQSRMSFGRLAATWSPRSRSACSCSRRIALPSLGLLSVMRTSSAGNGAGAADFLLQLQKTVDQRLGGRRTTRDIDVDRNDPVAAANHRIGIEIGRAHV